MANNIERLAIIPLSANENLLEVVKKTEGIELLKNITVIRSEPDSILHVIKKDGSRHGFVLSSRFFVCCEDIISVFSLDDIVVLIEYAVEG
jgi:hypothetical protein